MAGRVVRERCVLLLGMSGAGKSTVANHLVGHDPLSPDKPPFGVHDGTLVSVTREFRHEIVEFMWENDLYRVTVVDTVGTSNKVGTSTSGYGNYDGIVQYIRRTIDNIPYPDGRTKLRIDLVLFVMKKGRITSEERKIFFFIMARLHFAFAALVVTGCENDDTTTRDKFVQEFEVDPDTREIASQMGMGIYPVGFPPLSRLPPPLQQAYMPHMVQDRDMLRELIVRRVNKRGEQYCF